MEIGMNFETNFVLLSSLFLELLPFRVKILTFQQKEKETLGATWARFTTLINVSPNLSFPDHVLLHHFHLGLSKETALHLDLSSGGSFAHNTISERKAILEKILENTPYTGIYDEFPEEEIKSSLDQQKEAHTTKSEFSSYPYYDSVAKEPPIQGTYHTSRDDELHPFTCPFEFEDDLSLMLILGTPQSLPIQHHPMPRIPMSDIKENPRMEYQVNPQRENQIIQNPFLSSVPLCPQSMSHQNLFLGVSLCQSP